MDRDLKELLDGIELEIKCDYCHGKGREWEEGSGRRLVCGICDGSGYVATPLGEKVLSLVRHNLMSLQESIEDVA